MSADPQTEVARLLKAHGAILVRHKKHHVYELPNGKTYVQAATPSDYRAWDNNLRDLRKVLGLGGAQRGAPGERRERIYKPGRHGQAPLTPAPMNKVLAAQLSASGVVEAGLRAKIGHLGMEMHRAQESARRSKHAATKLYEHRRACWWCRIERWFRKLIEEGRVSVGKS